MKDNWRRYINGNYNVMINLNTGTKIRYNNDDKLIPDRPESIDVKITNKCNRGCLFCHENSIPSGKEAEYKTLKDFTKTLLPYTEINIGGGNIMLNSNHTEYFLKLLQEKECIPSITVHFADFIKYYNIIQKWHKDNLVYGIGVSIDNNTKITENVQELIQNFVEEGKENPIVLHVVCGIFNEEMYNNLKGYNYKLLILGFKSFRRGRKYYNSFSKIINNNIEQLFNHFLDFNKDFKVVSFDNLALKQLKVKEQLPQSLWEKIYMGDDGNYTFFVDLVEKNYCRNSISLKRYSIKQHSIQEMFNKIKGEKHV